MRVLFVNQILAHYRTDVLRCLEEDPDLHVAFAAGEDSSGIARISDGILQRVIPVTNLRVGRLNWQLGVFRQLVRRRPDILVCEGNAAVLSTWPLALMARFMGVRVAFWTIGWHAADEGVRRLVRLAFYRLAHGLLVYGHRGIRIGTEMGYPANRMYFVGNSSSVEMRTHGGEYLGWRARMASLPPGPVILTVIRLTPVKRLDLLIRAASLLAEQGVRAPVVFVGEGAEKSRLEALARELGVEAHFLGAAYDESQLEEVYRLAAVTVIPRAAGLTVLQSLRFGVPVVTDDDWSSQMPEAEAVIPDINGSLYRSGDVASLAAAMSKWLSSMETEGPNVRERCKQSVALDWSPQAHAIRLKGGLQRILGGHRR